MSTLDKAISEDCYVCLMSHRFGLIVAFMKTSYTFKEDFGNNFRKSSELEPLKIGQKS